MTDIRQDMTVLDRLKTEMVRVFQGASDEAYIAQLFADAAQEIRAQEARIAELAPWKDAVIDALAVCCGDCAIGTPPSDVLKLIASINQQFTEQNCKDREDERIAALTKDAEPYAYVRKWHFDGEKPAKVKNENNRWAWPTKFKFVSLSFPKCQPDDVPLYTHPPAPKAITADMVTDEMVKTSVFVNVFNAKQQIANVVNTFNGVKP